MADVPLEDIKHKKFKYVFVPRDIADPVEVREFEGFEKEFKALLTLHFNQEQMSEKEKQKLSKSLTSHADGKSIDETQMRRALELSQSTEIVSLTVPKKENNYQAINAYIDSVGRVKDLPTNARASRIASTDIRGDCILSRTFDNEVDFTRIDFNIDDFNSLMENPPSSTNRWNQAEALLKFQEQMKQMENKSNNKEMKESSSLVNEAKSDSAPDVNSNSSNCRNAVDSSSRCSQCYKRNTDGSKLMRCGRCQKVRGVKNRIQKI